MSRVAHCQSQENNLVISDIKNDQNKKELYSEILKIHGIKSISLSDDIISSKDYYQVWGFYDFIFHRISSTHDYLKTLGVEIVEGRDFSPSDTSAYIFNETAKKADSLIRVGYQIPSGEFMKGKIVGICKDIHFGSLRKKIEPMAFNLNLSHNSNSSITILIDDKCDTAIVKSQIQNTLAKIEPNFPHNVRMLNDELNITYANEFRLVNQISIFSIIVILICIIGVIGILILENEYRRKEVAIRKALGASSVSILMQFNWYYLRLMIIPFIISIFVGRYYVTLWLNSFAYTITMNWWVYCIAFLFVALITVACVSIYVWKYSNNIPVKSLNSE